MKCEDIERAFDDMTVELGEVFDHLNSCPSCARKYRTDLEIESALRKLAIKEESIDITEELGKRLLYRKKSLIILSVAQRWIWLSVTAVFFVFIFINFASILDGLNSAYFYLADLMQSFNFSGEINLNRLAEAVKSSKYFEQSLIIIAMAAAMIAAYLWREFKEIIK